MRSRKAAAVAGLATLVLAGAALAEARRDVHLVNLLLPDGSIEQVRYTGDVAPRVVLVPTPVALADAPIAGFAAFDRIAAEMDRRMDAMMQQAGLLAQSAAAGQPGVTPVVAGRLPAGTISYSYVSTTSSDGRTCSRSVQLTSAGAGQQPKLISQNSGDCSAVAQPVTPVTQPATAAPAPKVIPARLDAAPKTARPATRI